MIELFSYPFFVRAVLAGVMISILCGMVSVFVILRRMAFIGAGISHAAFGGVAIGFFCGINPVFSAIIYSVVTALLISRILENGKVTEDAAIGIFFSASMAIGVIFIGLTKNQSVDLFGYLFGNILTVEKDELLLMSAMFLGICGYFLLNFRKLYIMCFNEEIASVMGIKTKELSLSLMIVLSLLIVISMKVVGLILVSALLVIPAASAKMLTHKIYLLLALSCLFALFCTISGLFASFYLDLPSGGTIVVMLSLIFFFSMFLNKK